MNLYAVGIRHREKYAWFTHIVFVTALNEKHAAFFVAQEAPNYHLAIIHKIEKYVGIVSVVNKAYEEYGIVTYQTRPGRIPKRNMDITIRLYGVYDADSTLRDHADVYENVIIVIGDKGRAQSMAQGWADKNRDDYEAEWGVELLRREWDGEGIQGCVWWKKDFGLVYEG